MIGESSAHILVADLLLSEPTSSNRRADVEHSSGHHLDRAQLLEPFQERLGTICEQEVDVFGRDAVRAPSAPPSCLCRMAEDCFVYTIVLQRVFFRVRSIPKSVLM